METKIIPDLNISIIQPDLVWEDKHANLQKISDEMSRLEHKSDLIVLPEMFSTGFVTDPRMLAEPVNGSTVEWMSVQAAKTGSVITGSLVITEQGRYYNRVIWMQPDGTFRSYDKRHLFHPGNEHEHFAQGTEKQIFTLLGWKICPLVCYDLRFPVWSKNTWNSGQYEYDVLVYMANWPAARSYVFRQLLIARAIENQCFVVAANRIGIDGKGTHHQGDSTVLDFNGKHLVELPPDEEGTITTYLNYSQLEKYREGFTVGMDWDKFSINT
jgi:predicted amidohydrolase